MAPLQQNCIGIFYLSLKHNFDLVHIFMNEGIGLCLENIFANCLNHFVLNSTVILKGFTSTVVILHHLLKKILWLFSHCLLSIW